MSNCMNKIITAIAFILLPCFCIAQDVSGLIPQKDINRLNKKVIQHYRKKTDIYPQYDTVKTINVFFVKYDDTIGLTKERLKTGEFLEHIIPCYRREHKYFCNIRITNPFRKLLSSDVFVATRSGKVILGYSNMDFGFYKVRESDWDEAFVKFVLEKDIVSSYYFWSTEHLYIISVDAEKHIYVLRKVPKSIKYWKLEDFLDNEWPYLFPFDGDKQKAKTE